MVASSKEKHCYSSYLASDSHAWKPLACLANTLRRSSFFSCLLSSLVNSLSLSYIVYRHHMLVISIWLYYGTKIEALCSYILLWASVDSASSLLKLQEWTMCIWKQKQSCDKQDYMHRYGVKSYGLLVTWYDLICLSSAPSCLKSPLACAREAWNWVCASFRLLISSSELQRTGSVRSSSASSIQLFKAEAFLANCRYSSSTWEIGKIEVYDPNYRICIN